MYYYTLTPEPDYVTGGPFTARDMMAMLETGAIAVEMLAAVAGDSSWHTVQDLLPAIQEDLANPLPPLNPADFEEQVRIARQSGPPTLPVLTKLLKEDGPVFARPRKPPARR